MFLFWFEKITVGGNLKDVMIIIALIMTIFCLVVIFINIITDDGAFYGGGAKLLVRIKS